MASPSPREIRWLSPLRLSGWRLTALLWRHRLHEPDSWQKPCFTGTHWAIIIWLAVVNTAFAFTLWNRTLQILSALESSLINNTMLIQIAILAWVFLGETLAAPKILGLALASTGVWLAQRWRAPIA